MQKYEFFDDGNEIGCHPSMEPQPTTVHGVAVFYLASEVDARIAELEGALRRIDIEVCRIGVYGGAYESLRLALDSIRDVARSVL